MQLPASRLPVHRWQVAGAPRADGGPVTLPVAAIGHPTAPAVVLAHGVGSSARFVAAACASPLTEAGYRLVVLDQRGHGDATACPAVTDHGLDAYAADLAAVVGSVPGEVAAVGGISLGGHAAVRADLPHPRLVALPGWTGRRAAGEGPHAAIAAEVRRDGVAALTDRLRADATMPTWLRGTLVTDYARHDPASLAAALVALDGADGPSDDEIAALGRPQGPGLAVVAWPDDPGHPLEVARAWAARAGAPLEQLRVTDPDDRLTRFGDALAAALFASPPAWPRWATAPIEVVDPDASWPAAAQRLIASLRRHDVLATAAIEHIGSTAVPGLVAKPTLDLLADVPPDRADQVAAALVTDGWARLPVGDAAWKRSFALPGDGRRLAHLHLADAADPRAAAHRVFRDALRADPGLVARYAAVKREAARRHCDDREAYTAAKSGFVAEVLATA